MIKPNERYIIKLTLDKLQEHMQYVEESGDTIISEHYIGGRDWVLICRKASEDDPTRADRIRRELIRRRGSAVNGNAVASQAGA